MQEVRATVMIRGSRYGLSDARPSRVRPQIVAHGEPVKSLRSSFSLRGPQILRAGVPQDQSAEASEGYGCRRFRHARPFPRPAEIRPHPARRESEAAAPSPPWRTSALGLPVPPLTSYVV